jgi:nitrous oxide reductase accessory protein NosL
VSAVLGTVVCPVCGQVVKESPTRPVMLSHSDGVGRYCGMSGQPFGGVVQGAKILELDEVLW